MNRLSPNDERTLARAKEAFAELLVKIEEGKLRPYKLDAALRGILNPLDEFGSIEHTVNFLAHVWGLKNPRDIEHDPRLALEYLDESDLSVRERWILRLRFGMEGGRELSITEIRDKFGYANQAVVREILKKAINKIRKKHGVIVRPSGS